MPDAITKACRAGIRPRVSILMTGNITHDRASSMHMAIPWGCVCADGPVTGSVSAGRVRMRGASLALKKVQSLDARLEAAEGDVTADAVYARRFRAVPGAMAATCAQPTSRHVTCTPHT